MVLFAKNPIDFPPNPAELDSFNTMDTVQLWEIKETGELFLRYEDYLARREFYTQKKFTCEITRRSNLTFFEALESEQTTSREIKSAFPIALRRPILRHVHFSTVGRLEQLVSMVYETFKETFFPGEHIICTPTENEKIEGLIREKITSPETDNYRVQTSHYELTVPGTKLSRDRRSFSKNLIRSFLKNALIKEAWHGAPWVVAEPLAIECDLPLTIPPHLQQTARIAEKKAIKKAQNQKGAESSMFTITDFRHHPHGKKGPPVFGLSGPPTMHQPWQSRPGAKSKSKFVSHNFDADSKAEHFLSPTDWRHYPIPSDANLSNGNTNVQGFVLYPHDQPPYPQGAVFEHALPTHRKDKASSPQPLTIQIKFPIDDLDVPPKDVYVQRPKLKSLTDSLTHANDDLPTGQLDEKSVGSLLEVWNTLNVHSEVYILDSFTFDDFVEALRFPAHDVECELLSEVHCAVLKQLVDDKGTLQVSLPKLKETSQDSEEEEDDEEEEEEEEEETEEAEPEPPRRTTRSSIAKAEALAVEQSIQEEVLIHRAAELQAQSPWLEQCQERRFGNNAWQKVLAGILYQLSLSDFFKERCERILAKLVPTDMEPTDETVISHYSILDVNLRLDALEMIVLLSVRTRAIRDHLEKMSQEMTDLRKRKVEQQRIKRELVEKLQELDLQRKELSADLEAKANPENGEVKKEQDEPMPDVPEDNDHPPGDNSDDDDTKPVSREQILKNRKRKREAEAAKKEKVRKQKEAATKLSRSETKLKKTQDEMDEAKDEIKSCEELIVDITNDLRETDCQRTRCLGRDRFCNRYYWFERNGMPYAGVPDTSTSHYGYANGRLWVQGPDALETEGYLELSSDDQLRYKAAFGVTMDQRKASEEGETKLPDSLHWGYIDDVENLDNLINWLDERGNREKSLRKELNIYRDVIVDCMQKLKEHMDESAKSQNGESPPPTRTSSRIKPVHVEIDNDQWRCLSWQNSMAASQLGRRHGEEGRKTRKKVEKAKIPLDKKGRATRKR